MAPLISADNEIKLRRQLSQVFGHQEIMVYCGLLKPEEDLTLTLENGTSITLSPSLHAGPVRLAGDQWPVPAAPGQRPH